MRRSSHPIPPTPSHEAALIAIDARDPVPAESRLKALLGSEPRAAHLHFALGSLYAAQSRWPEAQQSWLNAYRFDRGNADYAYNLAGEPRPSVAGSERAPSLPQGAHPRAKPSRELRRGSGAAAHPGSGSAS